jgi:aminopeptidase N
VSTPRSIVLTAALSAVVALALPATAGQASRPFAVDGSPSLGDDYYPTYGNSGYDVTHYDLRLKYTPATDALQGTATLLTRPLLDLTTFYLDFALKPSSIVVNGAPATFTQSGSKVHVVPAATLKTGSLSTVVVKYAGIPSKVSVDGQTYWVRTADGAVAVGEPEIAAWWFPSNDHPSDKATFDISVAVPTGTEVLSNGTYTARPDQLPGWTRWNWRSTKPMATYLAFVAIGQYEIDQSTAPNGLPVINAYGEGLGANGPAARASIERTAETIDFESSQFGPYPFEAEGGVVPNAPLGFALENQTRPVYSSAFFRRGSNGYVVAHELAHEWYGDSVAVAQWRHVWLNEGFASYAEWLWSEHEGEGTPQELFAATVAAHPADDPFWQVAPADPGVAELFGDAVYDRGAMTLQALRNTVGDETFFAILKKWAADRQYGNGTTEEFINLSKSLSGKPLDALFNAWLYAKAKPTIGLPAPLKAGVAAPKSLAKIRAAHKLLQQH